MVGRYYCHGSVTRTLANDDGDKEGIWRNKKIVKEFRVFCGNKNRKSEGRKVYLVE